MSPGALSFRPAVESDYLNSYLRHRVLSSLPEREVDILRIIGNSSPVVDDDDDKWLLTDVRNPLDSWQQDEALEHWKSLLFLNSPPTFSEDYFIISTVMRQVLPDVFWETY